MKREIVEKIIDLTLGQVREKGVDLLDELPQDQVGIVYDAIERDLEEFEDELQNDIDYDDADDDYNPEHFNDDVEWDG